MHVLVTGENSYAGREFEKRILELNRDWTIDFISVRNDEWQTKDFSNFDAIYHVAAVVHQKEKKENESLYFSINRDLTYKLAIKAKSEGVKSFVFLSTMAVYGLIGKIGEDTVISKDTEENPTSYYGKSKLEAEQKLNSLQSRDFSVSILRIPMIYGYGCPGNYRALSKLARITPIFPKLNNRRSMIFVDHLSDVVIFVMKEKLSGILLIKNPDDVNTIELVEEIASLHSSRIYYSSLIGLLVKTVGNRLTMTRKMFSNVFYKDTDCNINGFEYKTLSFAESIIKTEGKGLGDNH